MPNNENTIDRIQEMIETGTEQQLCDELNCYHSADLADIFQQLRTSERLHCITKINEEKAKLTKYQEILKSIEERL